jgi:hypothetical protein
MPSRLFSRDSPPAEQQLPFTGDTVDEADFAQDQSQAENGAPSLPQRIRAQSIASGALSSSYTRNPIRSFAHQTSHGFAGAYRSLLSWTATDARQIPHSTRRKAYARGAPNWPHTPSKPKTTKTARTDTALQTPTHALRDTLCYQTTMRGAHGRILAAGRTQLRRTARPRHPRPLSGHSRQTRASLARNCQASPRGI